MNVCFVANGTINNFWQNRLNEIDAPELILFGFNGLGLVSYKKELECITEYFQDIAKLSKQTNSVIISGCDTDTYGAYRHSAVIAEKGKILGVSDSVYTFSESEFVPGGSFRVYQTGIGRIGVIVGTDVFFTESSKYLSLCDADIIVCVYKKLENTLPQLMLKASAFTSGIPMLLSADGYSAIADINGNISFASGQDLSKFSFRIDKKYSIINIRRKGIIPR